MEIHTTETSENPTETTETLDQSTLPLVADPQTVDASEQLTPPLVTNIQIDETSEQSTPPQVTNIETAETLNQSALPQVTNAQLTENLEQPTLPDVTNTLATEPSIQSTDPPVTTTQSTESLEQSTLPPLTNTKTTETLEHSILPDNCHDNLVSSPENHQGIEMRHETIEEEEEVRSVLKVIAATGKFWHDWEKLRSMLSLHLKQVISEYPQAKMTTEDQKMSLGETHAELVKRLDDALHSFVDGPPFTLQRLSEIILDARSLYPNLSKLALALEKNLSVTSTLIISIDPYAPAMTTTSNGADQVTQDPDPNQNPAVVENGGEEADGDEIMTEVEADVSDVTTMEVETSESTPMTRGNS